MRRLASSLVVFALVVPFGPPANSTELGQASAALTLPFEQVLAALPSPPAVTPAEVTDRPVRESLPDPDPALPVEAWFGCAPPFGGVCVTDPRVAEPFIGLIPVDPQRAADWRPLLEQFFRPEHVDKALRVIRCESGGDPNAKNPRSTASGLFQHLGSLWEARAIKAGLGEADIFDPVANVAAAAWLVYEGGGWGHWNPSRHCWG